jgi:hypothetical protein
LRVITLLPWSEPARYALVGVDIVLLLAALLGVGRRFGALTAWAVAAWTQLFYGMWKHSIGGLFQLDHLAALFGGLTAVASGRPALSGVLFAWACMSRIFPAFLVLGLVPWALASRHRDGRWPTMLRPFLLAFSLTCLLCLGLGTATGRGPSAWVDFVADMEAHTELHPFGKRRLGLEHIFTAGIGEELEDIGRDRKENLAAQRPIWAGLAAVLVAFWAWAGTRLRSDDPLHAMVAGLLPCFALIVLSRYYGAAYAAVALLALPTPRRAPTLLWAAMVATSVIPHWIDRALDKPFEGYVLGNLLFGAAFVSLAAFRLRREEAVTPAPTADPA